MTERRPPTALARLDFAATVLADTREAVEQERAGFIRQIAEQAETITKLEKELAIWTDRYADLDDADTKRIRENSAIRSQLAAVRQRVAELMDVVDEAEAEVVVGDAEVERLRRELRAARATIEVMRAERSSTPTVGESAFAEELAGAVAIRREIDAQRGKVDTRYSTGQVPRVGDVVRIVGREADREVVSLGDDEWVILKGDRGQRRASHLRLISRRQP